MFTPQKFKLWFFTWKLSTHSQVALKGYGYQLVDEFSVCLVEKPSWKSLLNHSIRPECQGGGNLALHPHSPGHGTGRTRSTGTLWLPTHGVLLTELWENPGQLPGFSSHKQNGVPAPRVWADLGQ